MSDSVGFDSAEAANAFGDDTLFWDWPRRWQRRAVFVIIAAVLAGAIGLISLAAADLTVMVALTVFFFGAYAARSLHRRGWLWIPETRTALIGTYGSFGIALSVLIAIIHL